LIRDEMEQRLLATFPVAEDDVLALLQRRIEAVQKFLIESGGVSPERLFPLTPKSGDIAKGEARAVFSLN
jgi:hypothetical protein